MTQSFTVGLDGAEILDEFDVISITGRAGRTTIRTSTR